VNAAILKKVIQWATHHKVGIALGGLLVCILLWCLRALFDYGGIWYYASCLSCYLLAEIYLDPSSSNQCYRSRRFLTQSGSDLRKKTGSGSDLWKNADPDSALCKIVCKLFVSRNFLLKNSLKDLPVFMNWKVNTDEFEFIHNTFLH
jgi:hypothetical protein